MVRSVGLKQPGACFLICFRHVRCSTNVQTRPRALNKVAQHHSVGLCLASYPWAACITRFARTRISLIEYLRTTGFAIVVTLLVLELKVPSLQAIITA